jgi:hypothetical protein
MSEKNIEKRKEFEKDVLGVVNGKDNNLFVVLAMGEGHTHQMLFGVQHRTDFMRIIGELQAVIHDINCRLDRQQLSGELLDLITGEEECH